MSLLSLSNVSASYGSSQALFGVNLRISEGEVVALMGRNGMGKSTTIKCICRMLPFQGSIVFDSNNLSNFPSYKVARLGIGLVPEGRRCFSDLSVYENLIAAARLGDWNYRKVVDLFPRLGERKDQLSASLSGGEQQMLAIGRALMTNPRLLILDEATEGLAPIVRQEIWGAILELKNKTGMSILVIDKSVKELKSICDSANILERGRSIWHGKITDLTAEITEKHVGV
jgi:branched-chain amino acid transport system ATP-binding protein